MTWLTRLRRLLWAWSLRDAARRTLAETRPSRPAATRLPARETTTTETAE